MVGIARDTRSVTTPPRSHLVNTGIVVATLGVLPFALDAATVWQVLGPAASAPIAAHSLRRVWRESFSTRYEDLPR